MATKKTKFGDEERLDDASMEKVIKLLEPEDGSKPVTKKDACAILNIAYNTTRLGKLIEVFKEKKIRTAQRRAEKRGKPVSKDEVNYIITEYLIDGSSVAAIAESSYRSVATVNKVLEDYGVPKRATAYDYFKPELVPEDAMRTEFAIGEKVYSTRYDSLAVIEGEVPHKSGEKVYRVWLTAEKWQMNSYQPASELASLAHLRELGVKV